jgi:hypothetical protein
VRDAFANAYAYGDSYSNSYRDGNSNANRDSNANSEAFSQPAAEPNTAAAPVNKVRLLDAGTRESLREFLQGAISLLRKFRMQCFGVRQFPGAFRAKADLKEKLIAGGTVAAATPQRVGKTNTALRPDILRFRRHTTARSMHLAAPKVQGSHRQSATGPHTGQIRPQAKRIRHGEPGEAPQKS